jgi:hypothetical protein
MMEADSKETTTLSRHRVCSKQTERDRGPGEEVGTEEGDSGTEEGKGTQAGRQAGRII